MCSLVDIDNPIELAFMPKYAPPLDPPTCSWLRRV